MFDLAWSEILVIGVVALLVIKPKDLPKALRTVGYWVRHARQIAAEFQSSLEQMAREAEIPDVKKELEDAGRKLTADIEKSIDPVEVEKHLFNPPETPPAVSDAGSAAVGESSIPTTAPFGEPPPAPPPAEEPQLPFAEPLPTQSPPVGATPPALEPVGTPRGPHDRG